MVNFFESLQCRILGNCISVRFFFFVIAKRDDLRSLVILLIIILITQNSAKRKVFMSLIFYILYSHSNFRSKVQRSVVL